MSLQTRTKLQQALKGVLNCCKLEIVFKTRLSNYFRYKDPIPKNLISGVVYKFQCGLCNESYYGESIRHLDIRSGEHIGVSPLTGKKVKPSNNTGICDHLLHCTFLPSFDNFSILVQESKKYLLEIKESLLIMRDKPSLNRNINSATLYVLTSFSLFHVSLFNLVRLFPSKNHLKIVKKKLFISTKHDLITGRDIPETRRQNILIKNLD